MDLTDIILKSEKKYLLPIEAFFKEKWGSTKLWSHDLSHHRRTWNFAKELLQFMEDSDQLFVEKLLIACYLHDIGMSIDPGEKHGIRSRMICELFLEENKIIPADHADLLNAIENHDNKDYKENQPDNRLLLYLTVADDLDAFGETGIERYKEIYLERGIKPEEMGPVVLKNAEARFKNFERNFQKHHELVEKHELRYQILHDYFN